MTSLTDGNGKPWLAVFDEDDLAAFFSELRAAMLAGDTAAAEACMRAWRMTAGALSDPETRAVLTSPLDGADFSEVPRP
jgi:hypothetical protein